jgi:hypothetical protein
MNSVRYVLSKFFAYTSHVDFKRTQQQNNTFVCGGCKRMPDVIMHLNNTLY